jgi:hypothetical protein
VPTVLKRGQIHVGDSTLVAKLDAYSAPRLVEYNDPDPCPMAMAKMQARRAYELALPMAGSALDRADYAPAVRIEARYQVDEYDVLILSADDSGALITWLSAHGYPCRRRAWSRVISSRG